MGGHDWECGLWHACVIAVAILGEREPLRERLSDLVRLVEVGVGPPMFDEANVRGGLAPRDNVGAVATVGAAVGQRG